MKTLTKAIDDFIKVFLYSILIFTGIGMIGLLLYLFLIFPTAVLSFIGFACMLSLFGSFKG